MWQRTSKQLRKFRKIRNFKTQLKGRRYWDHINEKSSMCIKFGTNLTHVGKLFPSALRVYINITLTKNIHEVKRLALCFYLKDGIFN